MNAGCTPGVGVEEVRLQVTTDIVDRESAKRVALQFAMDTNLFDSNFEPISISSCTGALKGHCDLRVKHVWEGCIREVKYRKHCEAGKEYCSYEPIDGDPYYMVCW
jgi:hypothetical protein